MRDPDSGIMRRARIGLLGMPVGELRNLDPLATACAADGRWSFLLIVAPLSVAGRRWLPARCHNSHTDSELVFLCSSGCSPVLADQALDDVGALDPGGHIDRLAGRRRALEHVMHRALALRVLGDAPQRIRVLVVRYPVESASLHHHRPMRQIAAATHHHVPRFHFILVSGNENVSHDVY
jgi:hypothetical protein